MRITEKTISEFKTNLIDQEKSSHTIEKYIRDTRKLRNFLNGREVNKTSLREFKDHLLCEYKNIESVNTIISSVNSFLCWCGMDDLRLRGIKRQRKIYTSPDKELKKEEYFRLLSAAEDDRMMYMLLQTLASTGIRIYELRYITVEAVSKGEADVICKNKSRKVLLPDKLGQTLTEYMESAGIKSGCIFCTKTGSPLDRSYIWKKMKSLCVKAGVSEEKVFPHNFRKLFARSFYSQRMDIAALADVLGHTSINTTRIYIMTTGEEHRRQMDKLNLVADKKKK